MDGNTEIDTDMDGSLEKLVDVDDGVQPSPKPTYASKAYAQSKPRDVKVDKEKNASERAKIKISKPTPEIPFKQVEFDKDLYDLMIISPWNNTIVIKVIGKPWYYPTLLTKLESMCPYTDTFSNSWI